MTVWFAVLCSYCHSSEVIKHGRSPEGKQRFLCQNSECPHRTFILDAEHQGRKREVKQKIVEMARHGCSVRSTARLLRVSPATVVRELKKSRRDLTE